MSSNDVTRYTIEVDDILSNDNVSDLDTHNFVDDEEDRKCKDEDK